MVLRVLIVHEHLSYAEAVETIVDAQEDLRCVGMATTVDAARRLVDRQQPDVVLVDLDLAESGVLEARELLARMLAVSSEVSLEAYERATDLGATGLVGKDAPMSEVLDGLRGGGSSMTVSGTTLELLLADARGWLDLTTTRGESSDINVQLTRRERQVLWLMREGFDATRMARDLHVSVHTARSHIKKVLAKLGAHSQLEAVAIANRLGVGVHEGRPD